MIPPQIEKHIGCSLPTVGGDIFDTYEGEKGWFKRVLCDTGKCIKKVEIEIVSDDDGNSYDDTTTMPVTRRTRAYRKCAEVKEEEVVVVA